PAEVDAFVDSGQLVDLMKVFTDQIETASSTSLKKIAPLAGFSWDDDDPAGDASMLWHTQAVGDPAEEVRQSQRTRLLTYNRNDVEATAAIRTWMRTAAIPSIADLLPPAPL